MWLWIVLRRHTKKAETDPHQLAGVATGHEVETAASAKALLRRAATLRPSLETPTAEDVGYLLGASRGTKVWASVEDSILLIGPPRSGKGLHVVINTILDAPGAVVTTITSPDNLTATLHARRPRGGPIAIFDPQRLADGNHRSVLRWSPMGGCHHPLTAMIRANSLAAATDRISRSVEISGDSGKARPPPCFRALLHAAALDGRSAQTTSSSWSLDPSAAPVGRRHPQLLPQQVPRWGGTTPSQAAMIHADPTHHDCIWLGVPLALVALADPRVLDAASPRARTSTSTPRPSSTNMAPSTCSPPPPAPAQRHPWWRRSWKTSSKQPTDSPPPQPGAGSTRRCCSR